MRIQKTIIPNDYNLSLKKYSKNYYSANGEDGIIKKIFDALDIKNGQACEFGAWDGKYKSNTFNLVKNHNWHCVMIEADQKKYLDLVNTAKEYKNILPINQKVTYDPKDLTGSLIDEILHAANIETDFDLISIDIDSSDYQVWKSMKKYKPKLVVVEYSGIYNNIIYSPNSIYKVDIDGTTGFIPFYELAKEKGYTLVSDTGNLFFLRDDCYEKIKDNPDIEKRNHLFKKIKNIATMDLEESYLYFETSENKTLKLNSGEKSKLDIIELIKGENYKNVLDVNMGMLRNFSNHDLQKKQNIKFTASMTKVTDKLIEYSNKNKFKIIKSHPSEIQLPDNSFDCVICFDLLEKQNDYIETVLEAIRVSSSIVIITFFLPYMEDQCGTRSEVVRFLQDHGFKPDMIKNNSDGWEETYRRNNELFHMISFGAFNNLVSRFDLDKGTVNFGNNNRKAIILRKRK